MRNIVLNLPKDLVCITQSKLFTVEYRLRFAVTFGVLNDIEIFIPLFIVPQQQVSVRRKSGIRFNANSVVLEDTFTQENYRKSTKISEQAKYKAPLCPCCGMQ